MKTMRFWSIMALFLTCLTPASGSAQETDLVSFSRVKDEEQVTLDPSKTYLLVESPIVAFPAFIVMPNDEQRADWARQRGEALLEVIERYPRRLASYRRELELYESLEERGIRNDGPPTRPVEPTEESFSWPDLESQRIGSTGPLNRFFKSDDVSLWLYEVQPGDYVFYGFGFGPLAVPGMGTCMCMGSVRFDVLPGTITALRVNSQFVDANGGHQATPPEGSNSTDLATRQVMLIERATDAVYDPRIPRERIVFAEYTAVANLPNWFGGMIARVEPIEGVLAYERDRMIDLRAAPAQNPTGDPSGLQVAAQAETVASDGIEP